MSVGNLALLYTPETSSANNKTYSSKRKLYQSALVDKDGKNRGIPAEVFALIKELLRDYPDSFSDKSVEARAKKLAKEATCVWS